MTALASTRSPLAIRDFRLTLTAGFLSDTGDWLLMIALPLYVFGITGSALGASTVFLAELVPALTLGPFLGVLVDRFDRRPTMVLINLAQGAALLPLLWAAVDPDALHDRLWVVYLIAALEAGLGAVFLPARQSFLPGIVPRDQLTRANGLVSVGDNLSRLIGSPLGGLVFATMGLGGVVLIDSATYLVSAALILVCHAPALSRSPGSPGGVLRQFSEGWRVVRRSRPLGGLLVIQSIGAIGQGIFLVLFVVFVVDVLHATDTEVGLFRGVQAIGGVLGGLVLGVLARKLEPRPLIGWGNVVFGVAALLIWNFAPVSSATAVYVGFFIAIGIPAVVAGAAELSLAQATAPAAALGRVTSIMQTAMLAAQGIGLLLAGALADRFGVLPILDAQALLYLLCGVLALVLLRERRAERLPMS
ncbi:MFS transporter [Lacisediminihabitans changchengi]|uniref:MFS transporter n=1 Tax=Lacisediminihabitans changchengi TaxID=2787634 RepID=A0A934SJ45_9MICO|nr:MFS transporter [Lacisediminihabitans changchengi]MBK4346211.1 MFS transporter [Lacisediminihabitans changchengi]